MAEPLPIIAPVTAPRVTVIEYPRSHSKLLQWLIDVATRGDVWQRGRMVGLTPGAALDAVRGGLIRLQEVEKARNAERRTYLLNRWGTTLVSLDEAQPAEGDVIVCERKDGQREQCIVDQGVAWVWRMGTRGTKFCNVSTLTRWRECEEPEKPVETHTSVGEVKAALERGRLLSGNGAGLANRPTAPVSRIADKPPVA